MNDGSKQQPPQSPTERGERQRRHPLKRRRAPSHGDQTQGRGHWQDHSSRGLCDTLVLVPRGQPWLNTLLTDGLTKCPAEVEKRQ
ncbi:unnamed protein product [Arctogadus glacialis]